MFGIHDLPLFVLSGLLLNLVPGPDSLLIIARGAAQGWRAGSAAALGICTGAWIHICAAALGLSALLVASSAAFGIVKILGAAYLAYIGLTLLFSASARNADRSTRDKSPLPPTTGEFKDASDHPSYRRIFVQGFLTNVLNPKVALFFLAFVPQFIASDSHQKPLAFLLLGLVFDINSLCYCNLLAVSAAQAGRRIRLGHRAVLWLNRTAGVAFVALGMKLALSRQS